jgi:hypothetical protein
MMGEGRREQTTYTNEDVYCAAHQDLPARMDFEPSERSVARSNYPAKLPRLIARQSGAGVTPAELPAVSTHKEKLLLPRQEEREKQLILS